MEFFERPEAQFIIGVAVAIAAAGAAAYYYSSKKPKGLIYFSCPLLTT